MVTKLGRMATYFEGLLTIKSFNALITLFSHFFWVSTLAQQLLFRSSYFFRVSDFFEELLFQKRNFFTAVIFSEQLLFQSETSTQQPPLEHRKVFKVVVFWNSYLFGRGIFRTKIATEELLFWSRSFCTTTTFSEDLHFGKKWIFRENNIPHYPIFPEICYLLRRAPFPQYIFSEEVLFHSYTSCPQLHFLFISYSVCSVPITHC